MKTAAKSAKSRLWRIKFYSKIWWRLVRARVEVLVCGYSQFESAPPNPAAKKVDVSPLYVGRSVERLSKYVPGAKCLPQAIAAQRYLAELGYETKIEFGVKADDVHGLVAHAWLLFEDEVVLGGSHAEIEKYSTFERSNMTGL